MLNHVFGMVLKMNLAALCTAAFLLPVKYVLQKLGCPRRIMFLLWAVIALRLICPVLLTSEFSLFNMTKFFEQPEVTAVSDAILQDNQPAVQENEKPSVRGVLAALWAGGSAGMLMLGALSGITLKRRLRYAVRYTENVYLCEGIPSSFVLGIIRPRIYIPAHTKADEMEYMITHERTHIERFDHVSKLAGYLLLSIHWINPLNWLLFKLFSDDVEYACDEGVIHKIGFQKKKKYLEVLLNSAVSKNRTFYYNVCFAENLTKRRVKNMIQFRKRSGIYGVIAALSCAVLITAFGTDAAAGKNDLPPEVIENHADEQLPQTKLDKNDAAVFQENRLTDPETQPPEATEKTYQAEVVRAGGTSVVKKTANQPKTDVSGSTETESAQRVSDTAGEPAFREPDEPADSDAEYSVNRSDVETIKMGTDKASVHDMLGVESSAAQSEREEYKLRDGNTAVFIYDEDDQLTRGYIAEKNEEQEE